MSISMAGSGVAICTVLSTSSQRPVTSARIAYKSAVRRYSLQARHEERENTGMMSR
jgi:hypothetical protein